MTEAQQELFETTGKSALPEGFRYQQELIGPEDEESLVRHIEDLPFANFQFHGFEGKRRVISFGWRYDFNGGGLKQTELMPEFLIPLRDAAACFSDLEAAALEHAITEYGPGAAIGWHKDRSVFGDVIGVSLISPCNFRLRRKAGSTWERSSLIVEPRSAYLLSGPARTQWEHSIPAVESLRYSVTFRTVTKHS